MPHERFTRLIARVRRFIAAQAATLPALRPPDADGFNALALDLFAAQFDRVPPYRALCETRGRLPRNTRDPRDIPAVPTSAFKELEFTGLAPEDRSVVFHSSGTTVGLPGRHYHSTESLALYSQSLRAWCQPHLLPEFSLGKTPPPAPSPAPAMLVLAPSAVEAPHSSLAYMFDDLAETVGLEDAAHLARTDASGAWQLDQAMAVSALTAAARSARPVLLLGTAFLYVHLLDHLERVRVQCRLPLGSRLLETGGYKGRSRQLSKSELHAALVRHLGISASHIVCEYGMSELSSQAYDRAVPVLGAPEPDPATPRPSTPSAFRFPPWARAWVVSPEDGSEVPEGGTGLLKILDLANVCSVAAVQTEDLAVRRGGSFELLGRAPRAEAKGCSWLADA